MAPTSPRWSVPPFLSSYRPGETGGSLGGGVVDPGHGVGEDQRPVWEMPTKESVKRNRIFLVKQLGLPLMFLVLRFNKP